MKRLDLLDHYWAERLAAVAYETGEDLPRDMMRSEHLELAKEKLLEWYVTPAGWGRLIVEQLWVDDELFKN
jgi:hypothetical protein